MSNFCIAHYIHKNWGDAVNEPLFNFLAGENLDYIHAFKKEKPNHILGIGSILAHAEKTSTVWGSGFIKSKNRAREEVGRILAVRGPLSRNMLLKQGHNCPEIYGDPALLVPLIYKPLLQPRYEYGLIPHYVDKEHPFVQRLQQRKEVLIIDVKQDFMNFLDQVCSCKRIVSSSLHGLIAADAYKIPSVWITLTDKVVGRGFKFLDYFESVGRLKYQKKTIKMEVGIKLKTLTSYFSNGKIELDLAPLLGCCPVLPSTEKKKELLQELKSHYSQSAD